MRTLSDRLFLALGGVPTFQTTRSSLVRVRGGSWCRSSSGKVVWSTRLATSVQGFPISFEAGGKQYIGVTTGLGGGSPRLVPSLISPEVQPPARGQALYVFALPDDR